MAEADGVYLPGQARSLRVGLKRRWGGYPLEAAAALKRLGRPGPVAASRFVLFGRGRSGSTLLVRLLDAHPDVTCLGEILRYPVLFPHVYIRNQLAAERAKAVGFKLLSYQLRTGLKLASGRPFLRRLAEDGHQLVYLHRENLFRHALSNLYAVKRGGVFHETRADGAKPVVRIEPREVLAWMEGSEQLGAYERDALSGLDALEITYERDLADAAAQQRTTETLLRRLGLAPASAAKPTLQRTTPESLSSFIANYEEVLKAVEGSRFARHLA